ncbi:MAG: hypothetical protein R3D52_01310 [Xanthobacteraceae bacterium]
MANLAMSCRQSLLSGLVRCNSARCRSSSESTSSRLRFQYRAFAIVEMILARLAYLDQGAVQPLQLGQSRLRFLSNGVANGDGECAQHHQENKGQGPHERLPESIE